MGRKVISASYSSVIFQAISIPFSFFAPSGTLIVSVNWFADGVPSANSYRLSFFPRFISFLFL